MLQEFIVAASLQVHLPRASQIDRNKSKLKLTPKTTFLSRNQ